MLTGVLARLGAFGISLVLLGAIFLVHLPKGFDITRGGLESALTQVAIAVAILIAGAGPSSLDYLRWPADRTSQAGVPPTRVPLA
jgi:putative oxidoreductase